MEILDSSAETLTVRLTRDEAMIINNALNEVTNGIKWSEGELITRPGFTREEFRTLLQTIGDALPR